MTAESSSVRAQIIDAMNAAELKECPQQTHYYVQKYKTCHCSSYEEDCNCSADDDCDPGDPHEWGALNLPGAMSTLTLIVLASDIEHFCCNEPTGHILFCGKDVNWSYYSGLWDRCHNVVHKYNSGEVAIMFR
jgi:hypothetical protein